MSKKIRVGILFGGKSAEHEVSLRSAKNVYDAIDKDKYEVVLMGIDKAGKWLLNDASNFLLNETDPKLIKLNTQTDSIALTPSSAGELSNLSTREPGMHVDVVFPILHGPFGEDGTVQGLLKLAGIPFVGPSVLGSAVGMDKDIMKRLLRDAGIPIGDYLAFKKKDEVNFDYILEALGMPVFVKPANMGSSVGVSKVSSAEELAQAVESAFNYDTKIVIESFIPGREIECAVLGNEHPVASIPGEVIPHHEFYSYDAKYIDENGAGLEIPAQLPDDVIVRVQELAVKTFVVLECEGLSRVDFFLTPENKLIVNEINTIPGFTSISMYPMLWKESGISYPDLIDQLIQFAIERFEREQKIHTSYVG